MSAMKSFIKISCWCNWSLIELIFLSKFLSRISKSQEKSSTSYKSATILSSFGHLRERKLNQKVFKMYLKF